jgi:hypothetical protein
MASKAVAVRSTPAPTPVHVSARRSKANGHSAPFTTELRKADIALFHRFRIPADLLQQAHVARVTHDQAVALGFRYKSYSELQGIFIPYLDRDGNPTAGARARRDVPDVDPQGRVDAKYLTVVGPQRLPYLLPADYAVLAADPAVPVVIVESEKAKLAGQAWASRVRRRLVFMAVGGDYGWLYKPEDADNSYPLPMLGEVLTGRPVTVQYDSNASTNPTVQRARLRLATYASLELGSQVTYSDVPLEDGVNGPDDYIALHTDREYAALLDRAVPPYTSRFLTAEDIKNARPPEFLIREFLQTEGITLVGGLSTHGKSWMLLLIVKALLDPACKKLFGHFPIDQRPARVIYITPEVTPGGLKGRLTALDLLRYVETGQLLVQAMTGSPLRLTDAELLMAARDAVVVLDPAIRFFEGEEQSNTDVHNFLSVPLFALLQHGAKCIVLAHHAPKAFDVAKHMSLENVLRGAGDIGAMLSGAWGVKKVADPEKLRIHVENLKPRDFTPPLPFELEGQPWVDGQLHMVLRPGECPSLAEQTATARKLGRPLSNAKQERIDLIEQLMKAGKTTEQIVQTVHSTFVSGIKESTIQKDIQDIRKRPRVKF